MAQPFTDVQIQNLKNAIAAPEEEVATPDRRIRRKPNDDNIKGLQFMVNANRSAAGTRKRQYRMSSSKGF